MGAQQLALPTRIRVQEEGIVHVAGRMVGRKVELAEIVVVGLNVRALGDRKAEIGEDRRQLIGDLRDRVDATDVERARARRQRDVDPFRGETMRERRILQYGAALSERRCDLVLQRVDHGALRLALLGRHLAKARQKRRDRALLAKRPDARRFKRRLIGGGFDCGKRIFFEAGQIGHVGREYAVRRAFAMRGGRCPGSPGCACWSPTRLLPSHLQAPTMPS